MNKLNHKGRYSRTGSLIWALQKLWRLDPRFIFFIFAGIPVSVALPLVESYFSKALIDGIGAGMPFGELSVLVFAFVGGIFLLAVLDKFVKSRCGARAFYPTLVYQTEMHNFEGWHADYENTEKQDFQKIKGYAWRDVSREKSSLEMIWLRLSQFLTDALGIVTYASLMVVLEPAVFAAVAIVSVLSYFTSRWQAAYYEKNKHYWEKESRKCGYLEDLSDDFSRAKDIKLYGLEGWLEKMMRDYQAYILMWNNRCRLRGMWATMLAGFMTLFQNTVAYLVLIELLLDGGITVGGFVFYFGLVGSIARFLRGIIGDIANLNTLSDKIAYYREFFDYPNKFNHGEGCRLPAAPVKIELRDVWYRYDGAKEDTLKGINLVIEAGENLALVGVNGAGKSTLVKLMCGLYAPTRGEILVGGRKIEEYNIEEYYSMISAVFQEFWPVALTVFEFVASAEIERPTAREDAEAAMKATGIYERIQGLAHGMDTHLMKGVYDDGVDLSGGEMQKLILARAVYKDGAILILDEPTSALDPIAENNLYLQYHALASHKTSIYISHRFASTRFCDRIVLLEDGIIKEAGTHEELMGINGRYAYMFGVQSKYYKEGEVNEAT